MFTSVFVLLSHPFTRLVSQSPNPVVHAGAHTPAEQLVDPFAFVHFVPQAPQLFASVLTLVSQPFRRFASQLRKPVAQTGAHAPATHEVVPFAFVHFVPQVLQLFTSVCVFASQPFLGFPSQLWNPVEQTGTQAPDTHEVEPLAFVQGELHAPQSVVVVMDLSQPLAALTSQSAKPALQDTREHAPVAHDAVAFARLQGVPQLPQLLFVLRLVSQPSLAVPLQSWNPGLHVLRAHDPDAHEAVALGKLQLCPQAPQSVSVFSEVSHPFAVLPSQFAKSGLHVPIWQAPPKQLAAALVKAHLVAQRPQ